MVSSALNLFLEVFVHDADFCARMMNYLKYLPSTPSPYVLFCGTQIVFS